MSKAQTVMPHLQSMLAAPVVLVIDTTGITRGIAPLIRGYLDFDHESKYLRRDSEQGRRCTS